MQQGKQEEKMLGQLTKWFNVERVTDAIKDTWNVMIAYTNKQGI